MIKKIILLFIFISILPNVSAEEDFMNRIPHPDLNDVLSENFCYKDSDCGINYLCKKGRCSPGCKEFYINWEHKCKQKYDCKESVFKFCYSCETRYVDESFCKDYCFDNKDCEKGEFCNERKVCEKIDYQEKAINFLNKTKWFFIEGIVLSGIIFMLFNFIRSKKKEY